MDGMIAFQIATLLLTLTYFTIILYYLFGWVTLSKFGKIESVGNTSVSVIVAARNEEKNIARLIHDLQEQSYPSHLFEVIIVDDHSEDATVETVKSFSENRVRLFSVKDFVNREERITSYKKKALEIGIANAAGELMVTTDADCRFNPEWLGTLVRFFESTKCKMIAAPVLMKPESGFFNQFQSLDYIGMMGITGATLNLGFPTMCNGANLAFTRAAFCEVNGYDGIAERSSGDDMLLMHKMANRWPAGVRFLKDQRAVVETKSQESLRAFMAQRMRWTSKSSTYSDWKIKVNLLLVYLFNLSVLVSALTCLLVPVWCPVFVFQIATKLVLDFVFLSELTFYFKQRDLMWLFLPIEFLHILYIVVVGFAGNFIGTEWKGRKVK